MINNHSAELWDVSNQYEREIIRITREYQLKHNISDTAFWILYTLHENESRMTQTDICYCLYAPRQSTNSALKKLEADGLVEKIFVSGNQKSKYIVLTQRGQRLAEEVVKPMKCAEQKTFDSFTQEEIEIFLAISKQRCEMFRRLL